MSFSHAGHEKLVVNLTSSNRTRVVHSGQTVRREYVESQIMSDQGQAMQEWLTPQFSELVPYPSPYLSEIGRVAHPSFF
jgi:hypothetical protein